MRRILVTGGTTFVSRYTAEYFVDKGEEVYVLNRNTKEQVSGVKLIKADRHELGEQLRKLSFDAVFDITAYTGQNVAALWDALGEYGTYILISSSAVYPEDRAQPFTEHTELGENKFWGAYGTNKIEAETELLERDPNAYILRPPYLDGEMDNVYREAFVFDCALADRTFYLPGDGSMKLQFFHVRDLCRMMERILEKKPAEHIYNVGNPETVSIKEWVLACYQAAGKTPRFVNVYQDIDQRNYFPFYAYEYALDISRQAELLSDTIPLEEGLKSAFAWYQKHPDQVNRKKYMEYIDENL